MREIAKRGGLSFSCELWLRIGLDAPTSRKKGPTKLRISQWYQCIKSPVTPSMSPRFWSKIASLKQYTVIPFLTSSNDHHATPMDGQLSSISSAL